MSVCLERTKSPRRSGWPAGARARRAASRWRLADGAERLLLSKGSLTAPAGAEIRLRAPGSGGYGVANERDSARAREDRVNGYVTDEDSVSACPACS